MRFDPENRIVELTRRNLVTLLAKLDDPESVRTLMKDGWSVMAVEDEEHYFDRPHGPVKREHVQHINTDPLLRDFARREYPY